MGILLSDLRYFYFTIYIRDDLAEMPEYAHCETAAYAPEPIQEHRRVRRYQYEMMGVVYPQYAEKNILIDYGVIEEAE